MKPVEIKKHADKTVISLEASVDVSQALYLREQLDGVLKKGKPISVDAGQVERIDTAAVQVLAVFLQEASKRGLDIQWQAASTNFQTVARLLGLYPLSGMAVGEGA